MSSKGRPTRPMPSRIRATAARNSASSCTPKASPEEYARAGFSHMGKRTPSGGRGSGVSRSTRPKRGWVSTAFSCSRRLQYLCSHLTTDSRPVLRVP
ncbi:hypothetical protein SRIMM317S_05536 [Streptomyces rimosus subsp. rimosus]